jgi:tyrosinase
LAVFGFQEHFEGKNATARTEDASSARFTGPPETFEIGATRMKKRTNIANRLGVCLVLCWSLAAASQDKCVVKPPEKPRVRLNANTTFGQQNLGWYADGVKTMKTRSATDPTSWTYQAAMHGTTTTPAKPLWNTCQHGSYFFLAWHRMYLYFFEKIVRAASNPGFDLPYWYYDNPSGPTDPILQLPAAFRNSASPLYVSQRNSTMNRGGYLPMGDVMTNYSMSRMYFTCGATNWDSSFGGQQIPAPVHFNGGFGALESLPHNAVHDDVGGWMSNPNTAAQDPIFWLHHANIDRLWDAWEKLDAGRTDNWDATWLQEKFFFYDQIDKTTVKQCYLTGKDIINDAKQLGYTYGSVQAPVPPNKVTCPKRALTAAPPVTLAEVQPANRITLGATPVSVAVPLLEKAPPPNTEAAAGPRRLVLTVDDIQFDENPGVGYEIYLNLPPGQAANFESPYYVGTIHFFGLKQTREEGHEARLQFDATSVVDRLQKLGQWKGEIQITFAPRGPREAEAKATAAVEQIAGTATIGKVSISEAQ